MKYKIINKEKFLRKKISIDIRIYKKTTKKELEEIANRVLKTIQIKYERIFILYYLPGMRFGEGAYASSHLIEPFGLEIKFYDFYKTTNQAKEDEK